MDFQDLDIRWTKKWTWFNRFKHSLFWSVADRADRNVISIKKIDVKKLSFKISKHKPLEIFSGNVLFFHRLLAKSAGKLVYLTKSTERRAWKMFWTRSSVCSTYKDFFLFGFIQHDFLLWQISTHPITEQLLRKSAPLEIIFLLF